MTEAIYLEVAEMAETAHKAKLQVSVSGMLKQMCIRDSLRKMAIDGYIVNTDTTPLKKQYEEMHKIGVNINQIAKKVNTTGDLYLSLIHISDKYMRW